MNHTPKVLPSFPLLISIILSLFLSSLSNFVASEEAANRSEQTVQTININTADANTLAKHLKGIGLKKAEAIIDYRERFGDFAHIDELAAVKGIGKSTLRKNAHLLSLN